MTGMCKCDTFVLCVFKELKKMLSRCDRITPLQLLPRHHQCINMTTLCVFSINSIKKFIIQEVIFVRTGDIGLNKRLRSIKCIINEVPG